MTYQIEFWGTRGSVPTPGPATVRYGGNTPCVSVRGSSDHLLVLDAGTGIRLLGEAILKGVVPAGEIDLLLSHTHWDHIQGLPFFKPLYTPGSRIRLWGPPQNGLGLETILTRQMDESVFPVPLGDAAARLTVHELEPGPFVVGGFGAEAIRLRHPGRTYGYRLKSSHGDADLAYLTDNELAINDSTAESWHYQLRRSLEGVGTIIHDAMYPEELRSARAGWGHSSPCDAVKLAATVGASRLVLFHHAPEHGDDTLDTLLLEARQSAPAELEVIAAREGQTLTLEC